MGVLGRVFFEPGSHHIAQPDLHTQGLGCSSAVVCLQGLSKAFANMEKKVSPPAKTNTVGLPSHVIKVGQREQML